MFTALASFIAGILTALDTESKRIQGLCLFFIGIFGLAAKVEAEPIMNWSALWTIVASTIIGALVATLINKLKAGSKPASEQKIQL